MLGSLLLGLSAAMQPPSSFVDGAERAMAGMRESTTAREEMLRRLGTTALSGAADYDAVVKGAYREAEALAKKELEGIEEDEELCKLANENPVIPPPPELEERLRATAAGMEQSFVMLVFTANQQDMFANWALHAKQRMEHDVAAIALDDGAYAACRAVEWSRLRCVDMAAWLPPRPVDARGLCYYTLATYTKPMAVKVAVSALRDGVGVLLMDNDIIVHRDPVTFVHGLELKVTTPLVCSCEMGLCPSCNSGFLYFRGTETVRSLIDQWIGAAPEINGKGITHGDQDALNHVLWRGSGSGYMKNYMDEVFFTEKGDVGQCGDYGRIGTHYNCVVGGDKKEVMKQGHEWLLTGETGPVVEGPAGGTSLVGESQDGPGVPSAGGLRDPSSTVRHGLLSQARALQVVMKEDAQTSLVNASSSKPVQFSFEAVQFTLLTTVLAGSTNQHIDEVRLALGMNLANANIAAAHVLYDSQSGDRCSELPSLLRKSAEQSSLTELGLAKLRCVPVDRNPTYADLFAYADASLAGQNVLLANADVVFTPSLRLVEPDALDGAGSRTAFVLSVLPPSSASSLGVGADCHTQPRCTSGQFDGWILTGQSWDAFIFRAPLPAWRRDHIEVTMNTMGAENRAAAALEQAGVQLYNPCYHVHAYHLHCKGSQMHGSFQQVGNLKNLNDGNAMYGLIPCWDCPGVQMPQGSVGLKQLCQAGTTKDLSVGHYGLFADPTAIKMCLSQITSDLKIGVNQGKLCKQPSDVDCIMIDSAYVRWHYTFG